MFKHYDSVSAIQEFACRPTKSATMDVPLICKCKAAIHFIVMYALSHINV